MAENSNAWRYKISDATKLVALLIVIGGAIANHYIVRNDLERAIDNSKVNATALKNISEELREHLIASERRAERLDAVCERVKSLERQTRRGK